jgi:hypothetical protein
VNAPSQYKRKTGILISHCRYYDEDIPNPGEKPDFCKVEKIIVELKE